MKKLFLVLAAAFAMVACQTDINEVGVVAGGEVDVTFEVGTPTRAYSDGATATVLQYAVYEMNDEGATLLGTLTGTQTINIKTKVELQLVTGNEYTVIFWAAAPNAPYTVDWATGTMTVNYEAAKTLCNDEKRDAFYKRHTFTVKGAQTETIELRRPFAQLNIGTNDYTKATEAGYTPVNSAVKVTKVYKTLDLWEGGVSEPVEVLFHYNTIAKSEIFPVTGYQYLAMNYLLVPADDGELVDIEFGYTETDATAEKTRIVGSVPVKRNHRTNIYGQLLTSDVDINIVIKPEYEEPALELAELQNAALNGGVVTLTKDVKLTTPLEVVGKMTINLNGKTIKTTEQSTGRHHYAIENYGTLVLEGEGAIDARGIKNFGTLIINGNVTITNIDTNGGAAIWNEGKVTINNGTFKTNTTAGEGSYGAALNTRPGGEAIVNGGTFEANSQLTYAIINEGKTIINNATVKGKHGAVAGAETGDQTTINGGTFELLDNPSVSDHCVYCVSSIKGGKFSLGNNTDSGAQVFYASTIATGYKAVEKDGKYYVVANDVTVAATASEVKDVFANGGTILLSDDIQFDKITSIEPGKEVHMNLNGKTVTVDPNTTSNTLIYVKDGAKLVIDGNGKIDLGAVSTMAVFAPYGELVIENGTFVRDAFTTVTSKTTGLFMGAKTTASNVTINGGYFDAGYYNTDAANVDEILAGTMTFEETADDVAKRGASSDKNKVRVAIKDNVSALLNHSGFGEFKVYGGTFVGANPAWGDEGCMLPTTPSYLRPWSYYQGALLAGQEYNENGLVLPNGYTITKAVLEDGRPAYTVNYSK